jgi:signal transduction histidine kinase
VRRADRLGTLGTLAAGLAHEINNPLVSEQTFLTIAPDKRTQDDGDFWQTYHALACSELERIRDLVSTMSRLAHGGQVASQFAEVCVMEIAREIEILMAAEFHEAEVELRVACAFETPPVWGVRPQLQQVLLNLVCNALHATPAGGKVDVRIRGDLDGAVEIVSLEVEDSGDGIAEENLERIFDPFFTTKDPDRGTGLGLMITHQIVCDHGGAIEVRSSPGKGARFCVRLPVKPEIGLGPLA